LACPQVAVQAFVVLGGYSDSAEASGVEQPFAVT